MRRRNYVNDYLDVKRKGEIVEKRSVHEKKNKKRVEKSPSFS